MTISIDTCLPALLISLLPNIGSHKYWKLINHAGSAQAVLQAHPDKLSILSQEAKSLLRQYQKNNHSSELFIKASAIIDAVDKTGGLILSTSHTDYPSLLKEIHHPPPILFVKGNVLNLSLPQLAVVGSRRPTHQGLKNAAAFSKHLGNSGFTITSGLALGIDGAAHDASVDSNAKTIAVMATGVDAIYPKRHQKMAAAIIDHGGTLVSEFAPSSPPKADHFPRRNRIISGLSLGVLVIEAAVKSGSLITAHHALEQGREVFAVPGSIHNPQSKGCHQLIKNGATLVEKSSDIIEHLDGIMGHLNTRDRVINTSTTLDKISLNPEQSMIIDHIGFEPISLEQLIETTGLNTETISFELINLEINGLIKRSDWGYERV